MNWVNITSDHYSSGRTSALPEQMIRYCQLDSVNKFQWNFCLMHTSLSIKVLENIFDTMSTFCSSFNVLYKNTLTHWGLVTHIWVSKLTIINSDNGLSPGRRQAIIWTNAGILLIRTSGTNFSEISSKIQTFWFKKMHSKMSSAKWRPFCLGLNVKRALQRSKHHSICKQQALRKTFEKK